MSVFLLFIFCQITSFNMLGCDQYLKKERKKKKKEANSKSIRVYAN